MNENRKSDILELECLMRRDPKYAQRLLEHINKERARFTEMRAKILSTAIPSYIVKKGENPTMEAIYPESVTKALEEIDRMEEMYFKNNKFARLYMEQSETI